MTTQIAACSLLLERFGNLYEDYSVYLVAYNADENGMPASSVPLGVAVKQASDINNRGWTNFIFPSVINVTSNHVLFTLYADTHQADDNFIVWINSEVNPLNKFQNGYAISSKVVETDSNFTGYYGLYSYRSDNRNPLNFFNVFGISQENSHHRCIKIYRSFNEIRQTRDGYDIDIPSFEENNLTYDNRQDWISGFKSNVSILNNQLTLRGMGRRIGFIDRSQDTGRIYPSNIGLPPSILSFHMSDGDDEFNCIGFAGSELNGLFKTVNSGASWTQDTDFPGNNITSIKIYPDTGSPKSVAVSSLSPSSKIYISLDDGDTWNVGVDVPGNDQINDIAWFDSDTLYFSTESSGVLKYIISTGSLTTFNGGLTAPFPVGRHIYINHDNTGLVPIYGFGYGGGGSPTSLNYFDVFSVSGSHKGYSSNFQDIRMTTYGFEYYTLNRIYWATENSLYANDFTWDWFRLGEDDDIDDAYSIYANGELLYVGLDTSLALSEDAGVHFHKNRESDTIKIKGVLERPVVQLDYDEENSLIYLAQNGAVSAGPGVFFQQVMNDPGFDNNVKDMVLNPVNPNFVHILTQSNLGYNDYVTFLIDNSSSLSFSDKNNKRKEIVEDISDAIYNSNEKARFQIIQFEGTNPESIGSVKDKFSARGEATNITGGFVLNDSSDALQDSIDEIGTTSSSLTHLTTPLLDSLNVSLYSILSGGMNWDYRESSLDYDVDYKRDDNASVSEHVFVIATDGKDVESLRTINDFVNNEDFKNKINMRVYLVVIGANYDKNVIYNLQEFFDDSNLFFCNTDDNVDDVISYISTEEAKNITEGVFRKTALLDEDFAEVNRISVNCKVPTSCKIKLRYRYSENNDSLQINNFTNYIDVADGENNIEIPNIQCRFFEFEIYMKKETTSGFPLVNSVSIRYRTPTDSTIVFNEKDYDTEKIGQVVLSRNILLNEEGEDSFISSYGVGIGYTYGLGIGYINVHNQNLRKLEDEWFMVHSNAVNSEIGDKLKPEQPSYTKRRVKELCTTTDYFNYTAKSGAWSKDMSITVYKGNNVQLSGSYDVFPADGIVRFHTEVSPNDVVSITLTQGNKRRLISVIKNAYDALTLKMRHVGMEFLDEQTTATTRTALPAFTSQSIYDTAVVLNSFNVLSSSNNTITGTYVPEKSNVTATKNLSQINLNDYIVFTFGELFEYIDSSLTKDGTYEILPQQGNWIVGDIGSADSDSNVISLTSPELNVKLSLNLIQDSDFSNHQYAAFRVSGSMASINNTYSLTIGDKSKASSGYDFSIHQTSETGHLESTPSGGSISIYAWIGVTNTTSSINDYLDYSSSPLKTAMTASDLNVRVINKSTSTNPNVNVKIQVISTNGNKPGSFAGLIDIDVQHFNFSNDTVNYPVFTKKSVLMEVGNNGEISETITVYPGVSYVIATISGTGVTSVGPPIKYENQPGQENVYFGDLNVQSSISIGRQSPDFIYQYARDISRLDFCAVADNYDEIGVDQFIQIDRYADYYNSNNNFVTFPAFRFISYNFSTLNKNQGIRTYIFKDNISNNTNLQQQSSGARPDITEFNVLYQKLGATDVFIFNQLTGYNASTEVIGNKYNYNFSQPPSGIDISNSNKDDAIEVLSEHGSIEKENALIGLVNPQVDESHRSYFWGSLNYGKKLSVVGNSNSVISRPGLYNGELTRSTYPSGNNRPITGVWASSLNRESVFTAIKNGRTFTTSGNRMTLDFSIVVDGNTYKMGEKLGSASRANLENGVSISVSSYVEDDARIEVYRFFNYNDNLETPVLVGTISILENAPSTSYSFSDTFTDAGTTDDRNTFFTNLPNTLIYYVKVTQNDKHFCIGSPIYVSLS